MESAELVGRVFLSSGTPPSGDQLELLAALTAHYDKAGVLGEAVVPALHRACPQAADCWAPIEVGKRPSGLGRVDVGSERGCIPLPWVGPAYRRGGVCVLGLNLRYAGGDTEFAVEHRIALDPKWGQQRALRAGQRAHGSYWSTATMRDVVAVQKSRRGATDLNAATPDELADALLSSARIQAVKCSPIGGRSSPTPTMNRSCPRMFVASEIDILRPSVLLVYGDTAHAALWGLGELSIDAIDSGVERDRSFRRGAMKVGDATVAIFLLTHPGHGRWHVAHRALVTSLKARPVV